MWWLTHARPPRARQNVFLSSAPHASSGRGVPAPGSGSDAAGRSRANDAGVSGCRLRGFFGVAAGTARTTESSVRVWIGRSWTRNRSAISREPLERVVVAVGDRLVGHVGAGHHERLADFLQQHVVKRRVGEHHSELGRSGRDGLRDRRIVAAGREHDRTLRAGQQLAGNRVERHERLHERERRRHQRERLVLPMLARPQRRHRALVAGEAGEVVAADALDRDDRAARERGDGGGQRVGGGRRGPRSAVATVRRPRMRSAGRGTGGRPGRRTRPGTPGTS